MDYDSEQARIRRMLEEVEREWEVNDENPFQSDSEGHRRKSRKEYRSEKCWNNR